MVPTERQYIDHRNCRLSVSSGQKISRSFVPRLRCAEAVAVLSHRKGRDNPNRSHILGTSTVRSRGLKVSRKKAEDRLPREQGKG